MKEVETMEKRALKLILISLAALMILWVPSHSFAKGKGEAFQWTPKAQELRMALRDLWVGHIFWVRNVVVTTKFGDAEAAKVEEQQVVQNARDIANAIVPYYGKEAGDKLFTLLAGHYGAVKDYMNAVFSGKMEAKDVAMDKMKKNVDDIATFLSTANPNWPKETLVSALLAHGGFHMAQIEEINKKDFASEAKTWDGMEKQILTVADVLAEGIVKQFSHKFGEMMM